MKDKTVYIDIGKQFSRYPAGRKPADGQFNGELFREKYLKKNLQNGLHIKISLDNAVSYGSSFLEEAFGGLIRVYKMGLVRIRELLSFDTKDPFLADEIWRYVEDAASESQSADSSIKK